MTPLCTNQRRRGSTLLEFALAGAFIFAPMLIGLSTVGMSALRSMQVIALNRNAGHMFAMGVDFSQAGNKDILQKISGSLQVTDAAGKGVMILSEIAGTGNNQAVCTRQFVFGNTALRQSSYTNPAPRLLDGAGNVTNMSDPSASANAFAAIMPIAQGQTAYVAETYFSTAEYDWTGFLNGTGVYAKAVF